MLFFKPKFKKYGWKKDLSDHRDQLFKLTLPLTALPPVADLRNICPLIYDQGQLGSCTANAIAGAINSLEIKNAVKQPYMPSRLFIYYNERVLEGTVKFDSGASLRDGIKTVSKQGVCSEVTWPYNINRFKCKPSRKSYQEAKNNIVHEYQRIHDGDLIGMKTALAKGLPFVFGFSVYESFESQAVSKSGIVPMPQSNEKLMGGHAVMACGYDDSKQMFLVRNSWGQNWGLNGYCWMPYTYLSNVNLANDFWVISQL